MKSIRFIPGIALVLLLGSADAGRAQGADPRFWVTNGPVDAVAEAEGTVYIGGRFSRLGPATGCFVGIDETTGSVLAPVPMVAGFVSAVAPDGSGGWYIGGNFWAVQGQPRDGLAHLDAAGNLTAWNPQVPAVRAIAVDNGTVYIGGYFVTIDGQQRFGLAALDGTSGELLDWNPGGADGVVTDLVMYGGTVYACGQFTHIGIEPRFRLAAMDAGTGAVTDWNPNPDQLVTAMVAGAGVIYVGGSFSHIGGQARIRIAALDPATGMATSWNPIADSAVNALAVRGGTVYAGGTFNAIGGQARPHIAALDAVTGAATSWSPDSPDHYIQAVAVTDQAVYVGGFFHSVGGQPRNSLAALDPITGAVTAFDPSPNLAVRILMANEGALFAAGDFTSLGGVTRAGLAALDVATGMPTNWHPTVGAAFALTVAEGTVYAGGPFGIAAIESGPGAIAGWSLVHDGDVFDLCVNAGTLYAAGSFGMIGGQERHGLAAIDAGTGALTNWDPNPGPEPFGTAIVSGLAADGNTVYAGGEFTSIGGEPRTNLAALDAVTGMATAWDPGFAYGVQALAAYKDRLFAAGNFFDIGGQERHHLAALDAATAAPTSWNPNLGGSATSMVVDGGTVFVGGYFLSVGSEPCSYLAAIDAASGEPLSWFPALTSSFEGFPATALSIAADAGRVYVGGDFRSVGVAPNAGFAAISKPAVAGVEPPAIGKSLQLFASPNPFTSASILRFTLQSASNVSLGIYDARGRLVRELDRSRQASGPHHLAWDGRDRRGNDVEPGIYFVHLTAGTKRETAKVVKLR